MNQSDYLIPWDGNELDVHSTDILVLGSGIAGLFAAINLSEKYEVTILTKKNIMAGSTEHAQGGIAVALSHDDSPEFHFGDTIKAGAGLCNLEAVKILAEKGPECVKKLIELGAQFDKIEDQLAFTREGAHSRKRILHAGGDETGGEIERVLVTCVRERNISVRENFFVIDLLKNRNNQVAGVIVYNEQEAKLEAWLARAVIMATGGLGQLYKYTTNPSVATGDGLAIAFRAGAELMDMEFIQFHPTALSLPGAPRFLISEAARGEGAKLINAQGQRFMKNIPGQELAPRDLVARTIWKEMAKGPVFLDMSCIGQERVKERFPGIYRTCLQYGIDISNTPIPIAPATHFLMGGVRVNILGETNLPNLYACGECACNGVHGANRLASNSLLDGLVFTSIIVERIKENISPLSKWEEIKQPEAKTAPKNKPPVDTDRLRSKLREVMWEKAGIIRSQEGLSQAQELLNQLGEGFEPDLRVSDLELSNMLTLGRLIVRAALEREESRGGHFRSDFPQVDNRWQKHSVIKRGVTYVRYVAI
ncbi:MAG: L-aspartate oxidase [Desulfitobacteriia bacterium]|jgi:L-aspartate oxidase